MHSKVHAGVYPDSRPDIRDDGGSGSVQLVVVQVRWFKALLFLDSTFCSGNNNE